MMYEIIIVLLCAITAVQALQVELIPGQERCFKLTKQREDGRYTTSPGVKVKKKGGPYSVSESGEFQLGKNSKICFLFDKTIRDGDPPPMVQLDMSDTQPLHHEDTRHFGELVDEMQHSVKDILQDFQHLDTRKQRMDNTNESTHNRLMLLSGLSPVVLLCLMLVQISALRKYFVNKKLIPDTAKGCALM